MTPAGLVLAAGGGRRFGGPKALARLDGELLVERAVQLLIAGGCDPVVVVVGAAADEVVAEADLREASVVVAAGWRTGLAASLRAGLQALHRTAAGGAVVTLVDQPQLGAGAVVRLREAWEGGAVAAVATYGGAVGHPVLLDRSVWSEVAGSATADTGARAWLRANPNLVTRVSCDGTGSPADVDVPADLAALQSGPRPPLSAD